MSHDGSVERARANQRRAETQRNNALRRARLEQHLPIHSACPQSETVVLVPWHTDATGCRARTVGCLA
jgi:hypothetical protein